MQTGKEDEAALLELSSADEWYAAINGVPVGPVRIGELRRKAALGAVTGESLVWQEGMEEWRPVKQVPELAALVRDAAATRGPSLGTPDPPNVRGSVIPPAPAPPSPSMRPGAARPTPPRPASERPAAAAAAARSNVVPITSRLATAEKLDDAPAIATPPPGTPASERFSIAPDPFSAPAPAASANAATPYRDPSPAPQPSVMQPQIIVQQQKAPPNFIGIGVILAFVVFGGVAAYAIFFKPPAPAPAPQIIYQQVPGGPTAAPAPTDSNAANDTAPVASVSSGKAGSSGRVASSAATKDAGVAQDLGGLLKGLGAGPSAAGGGPSGYSGTPLTSDQLQSIVQQHQVAVRRQCVDKGAGTVAASNETVQITIGPNGSVSSAVASGNDPVTGHCLENEIKRWQFPATGTTATVAVPFKFVRQ
jgi:hypothetical protein